MKELCWLLTTQCNQHCGYCSKFTDVPVITDASYPSIIDRLGRYGARQLTFGGGEPFLTKSIDDIVRLAKDRGIRLKVVTNGDYLKAHSEILPLLDEITISLDSANPIINERLGRGRFHDRHVRELLSYLRENGISAKLNINTVASRYNLSYIHEMRSLVESAGITAWRILRFSPLRGRAVKNKDDFEIGDQAFKELQADLMNRSINCRLQFVDYDGMSHNYLLIAPDGGVYVSEKLNDIKVGNILTDDLTSYFLS